MSQAGYPGKKISEAENQSVFPRYLPSFNARIFCVLAPNSPTLCVSTFFGLKFAWGLPWWWGRGGSDLDSFASEDEYIFAFANGELTCNGVFKGGSTGKTIYQPFCKNACFLSSPSLHFSLVRLDSTRL